MLTSKVAKSLRSISATLSSSPTPSAARPPAPRAALAWISAQLRKRSPAVTPAVMSSCPSRLADLGAGTLQHGRAEKGRQRLVVRPMRQHARLVQHDDAMDRRPHRPAEQFRIDVDDAGRRHFLGAARDVARRPLGLRTEFGMLFVDRRIDLEHDAIGVRVLEREGEIGLAGRAGRARRCPRRRSSPSRAHRRTWQRPGRAPSPGCRPCP